MKPLEVHEIEMDLLLQAIYLRYHYDFRAYSRASVRRRLSTALAQMGISNISGLQMRILHDPEEFRKLLNYMTVGTTEMFRDPTYYASLRNTVFPYLRTYPSLKIWIAGSSSGEEVYSFAILLKEEGLFDQTILYATDINQHSLEMAKRGIFSVETAQKGAVNYRESGGKASLSDYFVAAYESVQFDPELRKNIVFSDHSLATDSVFAEVQMVSCRNVLIYFDRALQNRAIGLFRDSLVHGGFLGLGSKESLHFSEHKECFEPVVQPDRIFRKKGHLRRCHE